MPNVPSVLVVGGGLTSAAVSRALRRQLPVESVTVWEALGSLGGRMHTERTSVLGMAGLADTGWRSCEEERSARQVGTRAATGVHLAPAACPGREARARTR